MNDLEKEVVREKKYEENRRKMDIVKRNLMISRIYNVYLNLAVTLISAASMYIWVSYTSAGIKWSIYWLRKSELSHSRGSAQHFLLLPYCLS